MERNDAALLEGKVEVVGVEIFDLQRLHHPQIDGIEQRHELRGNRASPIERRERHRVHELPFLVVVSRGEIAGLDTLSTG